MLNFVMSCILSICSIFIGKHIERNRIYDKCIDVNSTQTVDNAKAICKTLALTK